jgi:PAS domain S-box-containing protein
MAITKALKDLTIFTKLFLAVATTGVIFNVLLFVVIMPIVEKKFIETEQHIPQSAVGSVVSTIQYFYGLYKKGEMNEDEAKKRALSIIRIARYKGDEYFWINDLTPKMIMHPIKPELEGIDLREYRDPKGKRIFVDSTRIARETGGGFVDYMWPMPGQSKPVPKISYVQYFEPWGWVIGSGIYLDKVAKEMRFLIYLCGAFSTLAGVCSIIFCWAITSLIRKNVHKVSQLVGYFYEFYLTSTDLMVIIDPSGAFINTNPACTDILGYSEKELLARPFNDFIHPEDKQIIVDKMDRQHHAGSHFVFENRCICKNGSVRWLEWHAVYNKDEETTYAIGRDITEHKQIADILHKNEERLSRAQSIAHVGDWELDLASYKIYWSDELYRIYGYHPNEIAPDYGLVLRQMHPNSKDAFQKSVDEALKEDRHFEMDYQFFRKDGSEAFLHTIGQVFRDAAGSPIRMAGIVQDITERMNAEFKLRESEEKFRTIFEQAIDGIMIADAETHINIEANSAMCTLLGYAPEELIGGLDTGQIHPQSDRPALRDIFEKQLRGELSLVHDVPMLRKDGTVFYADVNATRTTLGGKQCMIGIFRDITDRKQAERALIIREKQLAESQRMAHIGSWEHNLTTGEVVWSEELFRILGLDPCVDPADINEFFRMIHPDDQLALKKAIEETVATGKQFKIDYRFNLRNGETKVLITQAELKHDETGMQNILRGTVQDITDRKEAEEKIKQSEAKYHNLFESSCDSLFLIDLNGKIIDANSTAYVKLGYSKEELLSLPLSKLVHPTFVSQIPERLAQICEHGAAVFESAHLRKDGTMMPVEVHARQIEYKGAAVNFSVVRDITERKQAEEERQENLLFIDTLLKNAPIGIRVFDGETGKCILANQTSADIAGGDIESMRCQSFLELDSWRSSGLLDVAKAVMVDGCARTIETNMVTSFGKHVFAAYIVSKFVVAEKQHLLIIGRDITAEKQLEDKNRKIEDQMLHAQKLESLGVLAGGIAHDFNNILMAILGNAELAMLRLVPESPAINNLKQIELAAQRAADLAQQMLAYSGKGQFVVEGLDINVLIAEMNHILEVSISKKALIRLNLEKQIPLFEGDATQIRQIIMNLVINASEAIGEEDGFITITTGSQDYDHAYLSKIWLFDELKEGTYIYFEIADTGCGMDRKTLDKIFDPFFTTKFTGRGLGMAAVLGIVRGHHGAITVYSELGVGTSFKVFLPAKHEITRTSIQQPDQTKPPKGSGTVLLVDDEETILSLGREMLKELGYTVFTAEYGAVAVEIFKNHKEEIACVILDLIMPRLDGNQTLKELQLIDPHVQVIMSSGYNAFEVALKFAGRGLADFIQKPYELVELGQKLQKAMQV